MPVTVPLNRNGMTARLILQATPNETKARARNVYVFTIKAMPHGAEGGIKYLGTTRTVRNDDGSSRVKSKTYRTSVTILNRHMHVEVDCECMYQPMWGAEVALNKRKAAQIVRSNGKLPTVRNPRLQPYACKHVLAIIWKLQAAGKLR